MPSTLAGTPEVEVWGTLSRFVQITVVPTYTVKLSSMELMISDSLTVGPWVGGAVGVGVWVVLPFTSRLTDSADCVAFAGGVIAGSVVASFSSLPQAAKGMTRSSGTKKKKMNRILAGNKLLTYVNRGTGCKRLLMTFPGCAP